MKKMYLFLLTDMWCDQEYSGWAQVEQGYAAEVDGMKVKLEYDFYYIKNFSFWLDLLITFKTIKTIITGFGAR
jgi:lipopolysaccharide/colanic/teichoic acid biosynthesis glycosyltransferase